MAKSSVIFSNPKSKPATPSNVRDIRDRKNASKHSVKRDARTGLFVLPPGPPNTIVRTPYPIAPKDGEFSD